MRSNLFVIPPNFNFQTFKSLISIPLIIFTQNHSVRNSTFDQLIVTQNDTLYHDTITKLKRVFQIILYLSPYPIQMQGSWKLMANKSIEKNKSRSSSKNTSIKFKPKKNQNALVEQSPLVGSRIINSLTRVDSSNLLEKKDGEFSRQNSQKKASIEKPVAGNSSISVYRRESSSSKFEKNQLYNSRSLGFKEEVVVELQRLKKQFKSFRDQIMNELKKQQKILEKIVRDTVISYCENKAPTEEIVFQGRNSERRETPTFKPLQLEELKSLASPKSTQGQIHKPQLRLPPKTPEQKSSKLEKGSYQGQRFDRFFQAISKLRNNLKDLGSLSEVDPKMSPKNQQDKQFTFKKDSKLSH